MLYLPSWRWDDSQKDTYGTGFGAGTGEGTVYRYGTWVRSVRYMGTICCYFCRYLGTGHFWYAQKWVRYMGTVRGYGFRTHVPYRPYPRTVPVPYRAYPCTVPLPYLYCTRTRTRTKTRTNRPVPIFLRIVPPPKRPIEHYS